MWRAKQNFLKQKPFNTTLEDKEESENMSRIGTTGTKKHREPERLEAQTECHSTRRCHSKFKSTCGIFSVFRETVISVGCSADSKLRVIHGFCPGGLPFS